MTIDQQVRVLGLAPAFAIGLALELFVGHRHDYTGHYAAGYGATLMTGIFLLRWMRSRSWNDNNYRPVLVFVLACIFAGWVTESTIFRFAKFDELDFCSQSLGAVLAGIVMIAWNRLRRNEQLLNEGLIIGAIYLGLGAVYAVR